MIRELLRRWSLGAWVVSTALVACETEAAPEWCAAQAGEPVVLAGALSQWQQDRVTLHFTELWRAG